MSFHWTNNTGGWSTAVGEGISTVSSDDATSKLQAIMNPNYPPWNGTWNSFGYYDMPTTYQGIADYDYKIDNNDISARDGDYVWLVRTGGTQGEINITPNNW